MLKRNDLVGGDQASCMLEALVASSFSNRFLRLPWAAADQQQLEGRSAFVAFVASAQGRLLPLEPATGPGSSAAPNASWRAVGCDVMQ